MQGGLDPLISQTLLRPLLWIYFVSRHTVCATHSFTVFEVTVMELSCFAVHTLCNTLICFQFVLYLYMERL